VSLCSVHQWTRSLASDLPCAARNCCQMFVPAGWWHVVLSSSAAVAVTQNFADPLNYPAVVTALCVASVIAPTAATSPMTSPTY